MLGEFSNRLQFYKLRQLSVFMVAGRKNIINKMMRNEIYTQRNASENENEIHHSFEYVLFWCDRRVPVE